MPALTPDQARQLILEVALELMDDDEDGSVPAHVQEQIDRLSEIAGDDEALVAFAQQVQGLAGKTQLALARPMQFLDTALQDPLVGGGFPFMATVPIYDDRLSDECRLIAASGLDGTNIFAADDPEWERLKPPRRYGCRCTQIALSIQDAARMGVRFAQKWLKTGRMPGPMPRVRRIPWETPEGWVS